MNRRQFIFGASACAGGALIAGDEKTTDGGFAEVSWSERERAELPVLPAGSHAAVRFAKRCLGCNLCVAVCPSKCLRPSTALNRLGKVELDFRYGWCRPDCNRCGAVCPVNAIERIDAATKRNTHVGFALWNKERCVRTVTGDECHACEKHCPVKAIKLVNGFPVVNRDACIGCGACEHYCPARPAVAIKVQGLERHREVRPISEADLLAEMRSKMDEGNSFVVAKDGVITFWSDGKMLSPIKEALTLDRNALKGATVMDKIVGKAAAQMHIEHGVAKVVTPVIARKAKAMLEAAGIVVIAGEVVERILNRDGTGECPLDAAIP